MPMTEAQKRAHDKYESKTYDKYGIRFKKDELAGIREFAESHGYTINGFVVDAVREKIASMSKEES